MVYGILNRYSNSFMPLTTFFDSNTVIKNLKRDLKTAIK